MTKKKKGSSYRKEGDTNKITVIINNKRKETVTESHYYISKEKTGRGGEEVTQS